MNKERIEVKNKIDHFLNELELMDLYYALIGGSIIKMLVIRFVIDKEEERELN